jgi:hypothetical protein
MSKEQLYTLIESRYKSRRAFIEDFNEKVNPSTLLNENSLSRYLSGKVGLSGLAEAAFILFFLHFHCA